jgi:hypothetical protein
VLSFNFDSLAGSLMFLFARATKFGSDQIATLPLLLLVSVVFNTLVVVGGNKVGSWSLVVLHTESGVMIGVGAFDNGDKTSAIGVSVGIAGAAM